MKNASRWSLALALVIGCGGGETAESAESTGDEMVDEGGAAMEEPAEEMAAADIVDTAVAAGSFSTLVAAVQAADLVDTLKGPGPFTVFAPTDDAFAALPEGTVENLLQPENRDQLVAILTYHVVSGDVRAEQVTGLSNVTTLQGGQLAVDTSTGGVRIGNANVVQADVVASNGVIHVIDTVLLPE